jgi:hypothetical protein
MLYAILALGLGTSVLVSAPEARAADTVTYEVVSSVVATATVIEYLDNSERKTLRGVALPWRIEVAVPNVFSASNHGAEVRADWRPPDCVGRGWCPAARPDNWVTVRIYLGGEVLCQNTLDVGNAACYGSTTFRS